MFEDQRTLEQALLRFPGAVDGLLRRCSPVIYLGGEDIDLKPGSAMVVLFVYECDEPFAKVAFAPPGRNDLDGERIYEIGLKHLTLDLTDQTGRAHLAWWIEQHDGRACLYQYVSRATIVQDNRQHLLLVASVGDLKYVSAPTRLRCAKVVPRLSLLWGLVHDRYASRLGDGSTLVDALALSLIGRHVAGLELPHVS